MLNPSSISERTGKRRIFVFLKERGQGRQNISETLNMLIWKNLENCDKVTENITTFLF